MRIHRQPFPNGYYRPCWLRQAVTLIEMLVVLGIMGLLMSLLMAAVQRVRMAALTLSCRNQMKQCSLAMAQLHDTRGAFPPGHRSPANKEGRRFTGWTLDLLPYVEQEQVFVRALAGFLKNPNPFDAPPHLLAEPIKVFACPADGRVPGPAIPDGYRQRMAFTSYLGVSGLVSGDKNGILFQDSLTNMAAVLDGTSNTLLLGERPPSHDLIFGWWYAGVGQNSTGSADLILGVEEPNLWAISVGGSCGPGRQSYKPSSFSDPCGMFHYWSPHPGGAHFGFADGSVRMVSYSARPILPALATRDGGETPQSMDGY